ncbi:unnamed protein product [Phyllotreta striolata]|uniref:G1/S-specific cyclin-D2 n=1 Tax=Phyllotreta striolata TaxID=444603 RepID=A0A9N9XR31_PHYSR|nr:unnamed protein product [Phyllotreta striolata]
MDLVLTCTEHLGDSDVAQRDETLFSDPRVINNLLNDEVFSVPKCDYFKAVQSDVQPYMRKVVATWMLEVCEEQTCEDQLLPLAINVMDRFLCECPVRKQQLQLLGATCLLIASKIRCTRLLPVDLLCAYTDHSVTKQQILSWELLVLSKLQWNASAVTGFDYIDHVIERCEWGDENHLLRKHAHILVAICYTEPALIQTAPSVIAAACVSSAVRGLKLPTAEAASRDVCRMLNADPATIESLVCLIDGAVSKATPGVAEPMDAQTTKTVQGGYESPQYGQPETPTEVEKVYI